MSPGFYKLKIAKRTEETAEAACFHLEIPENLQAAFTYVAGQYLTFETEINGEIVRRSYSLCSSPYTDKRPAVAVKRVENGRMSNWMNNELQAGSTVNVMQPMGKFVLQPNAQNASHYVLWAGGSGITPMLGIAKTALSQEPGSKVSLVYANRDPKSVIFKEEWEELSQEYGSRLQIIYSYDQAPITWFGLKGMLNPEKVGSILHSKIKPEINGSTHYICGPSGMMDAVKTGLKESGIAEKNIHTEYFSAPTSSKTDEAPKENAETEFKGEADVTIHVFGQTHSFKCNSETTVLNAAMKNGINPPYSCTVGVCTTCRARVHSGKLNMLEREGLSDEEIEQGYVLTCQSLPLSSSIEITYE